MVRLKITNRAKFYSQIDSTSLLDNQSTGRRDGAIILQGISRQDAVDLVHELNQRHSNIEGEFLLSESNPTDYDYVDYYIKYQNPKAP